MYSERPIIPIVFNVDENYIPHLSVVVKSIILHNNPDNQYNLYIMYTDLKQLSMDRIMSLSTDNVIIKFIDIKKMASGIKFESKIEHISVATFYRLLIPKTFEEYSKVIYIDCDLVVLKDLAILYDIDLDTNLIGACRQINSYSKNKKIKDTLGIEGIEYFNAGVLLMNLEQFRAERITEKIIDLVNSESDNFPTGDQDYLNYVCNKRVTYLDEKWNCFGTLYDMVKTAKNLSPDYIELFYRSIDHPYIVHYITEKKPWNTFDLFMGRYYWEIAKQSPFYEEILYNCFKEKITKEKEEMKKPQIEKKRSNQKHKQYLSKMIWCLMPRGTRRGNFVTKCYDKIHRKH